MFTYSNIWPLTCMLILQLWRACGSTTTTILLYQASILLYQATILLPGNHPNTRQPCKVCQARVYSVQSAYVYVYCTICSFGRCHVLTILICIFFVKNIRFFLLEDDISWGLPPARGDSALSLPGYTVIVKGVVTLWKSKKTTRKLLRSNIFFLPRILMSSKINSLFLTAFFLYSLLKVGFMEWNHNLKILIKY